MLLLLLAARSLSASAILKEAWRKVDGAQTITLTTFRTSEEFGGGTRTRYWFRKGGYFRAVSGSLVDVSNPKRGWTYQADKKIYQTRPPLPSEFNFLAQVGLDIFGPGLKVVGSAREVVWHKRHAVRVELDGPKEMTKETKLFVFVDPKTHLPMGASANLGSVTQVTVFENLKTNPKIPISMFQFVPPKGWKQVTAGHGGWN